MTRVFGQKVVKRVVYKRHAILFTSGNGDLDNVWVIGFGTPQWAESLEDAKNLINFLKRSF